MTAAARAIDTDEARRELDKNGFFVVKNLVSAEVVQAILKEMEPPQDQVLDRTTRQSRGLKPHLANANIWNVLSSPALTTALREILDDEPACIQSMYYFKPPGSSGLGLHRDKQYIRVEPGNTLAVWIAIDPARQENGCLLVVPGSHVQDVEHRPEQQSPFEGDRRVYTDIHMRVPDGMAAIPVEVDPGDAILFGGHLIHGSLPNSTESNYRRSLVGHYVRRDTTGVSRRHHPILDSSGQQVTDIAVLDDPTFEAAK
ncbi:ectoine hydroxylase-related dioxygenase (phytanoyl-CoA dioxygenase family) [Lentzea atacamensis]|uniref:Ectoine hydroxylase-related dioxygenase (Phytanoyl-CoA dioxygenase family) n=1 Tax=Lentzea atacamensis TaxID=531938 RepID=A0A316I013_9PSEU|nr:phytanoyl-CoA dioxygenase family protein [Lentzea atacamensis]PWK80672.1 ectoine hydroxylase-related dioxygenase (phytanoyl-CoA dioxygenase family) [Lentzea atacamensis]